MAASAVLVIDIGTSSTRASLYDFQARVLGGGRAQIANRPVTGAAGDVTFDLAELQANVVTAVDDALAQAAASKVELAAVALSTFVTNVVGVAADGAVLTPLFTYASPSTADAVRELRRELGPAGERSVHQRTGCPLHSSYLPARFRWLQTTAPELLAAVSRWMTLGEYLQWRFTGVRSVSYSAAAWTGLLDRVSGAWDGQWFAQLPIRLEQFGELVDLDQPALGLQPEWAQRWPALAGVPWLPALGDGAAANVGSGALDSRLAALTIGTTGALRVIVPPDQPELPPGLWFYRVTKAQGLLGGATTEGGNLLAWLRSALQLPPANELEVLLRDREPGARGLTLLPFVAGERAPNWNDAARAVLQGLTLATSAVDIYHAALEGIAARFALIGRCARDFLGAAAPRALVASGGALTNSPAWLQIMADCHGLPIQVSAEAELTSRGAALLALSNLHVITSPADLPPAVSRTYLPDAERVVRYRQLLDEHVALYERLY